jgi:eukaryotic-like serine/threonine-protein kinase
LLHQGEFTQAEASIRRARGLLPPDHPFRPLATQQLNQCRHWLALEKKLPDVLSGKLQPANAAEQAEYAGICLLTKRFAAAARFFTGAFADPKLANNLQAGHRYNAACAAGLAGCGQGKDAAGLDAKERERLRQQALTWLRADLALRQKQLTSWWPGQADEARAALRHWQKDADLAGLRSAEALAKIPGAERQAWQKLWADIGDALTKAQKKTGSEKK